MSVITSQSYHNVKCVNYHHLDDAERDLGYPVIDNFTMTAEYDNTKEVVFLNCPWCGYMNEVDVSVRPTQVHLRNGNDLTIGPPAK